MLPQDQNLSFTVAAVDGDGDVTSASPLVVDVVAAAANGAFTLTGTSGDDNIGASTHTDTISGGSGGFDIVDYSDSLAAISINLNNSGAASGAPVTPNNPSNGSIGGGDATGDSLSGIEGVRGGSGNDYLYGNSSANTLYGNAGNDVLNGEEGNDLLYGGSGLNTMTGGSGDDTFVIDPSALTEGISLVDVIADFTPGAGNDILDLSDLLASLGANAPTTDADAGSVVNVTFSGGAAHVLVDDNGTAAGGAMHEVASLTGVAVGSVISILYDDTKPVHSETVT